jgi:hypothetical protein
VMTAKIIPPTHARLNLNCIYATIIPKFDKVMGGTEVYRVYIQVPISILCSTEKFRFSQSSGMLIR